MEDKRARTHELCLPWNLSNVALLSFPSFDFGVVMQVLSQVLITYETSALLFFPRCLHAPKPIYIISWLSQYIRIRSSPRAF